MQPFIKRVDIWGSADFYNLKDDSAPKLWDYFMNTLALLADPQTKKLTGKLSSLVHAIVLQYHVIDVMIRVWPASNEVVGGSQIANASFYKLITKGPWLKAVSDSISVVT